jgi:hypothetical protein
MSATAAEAVVATRSATGWRRYPSVYEINSWVWLSELKQKYGRALDLSSIPFAEWDAIAAFGFDAVWLMGVWERSPAGASISNANPKLQEDFRRALPDFRSEDNVGSPYCVRRYVVDRYFGGPHALADARCELSKRGMNLILDFVPNHVAPDHPWVTHSPQYFVPGNADNLAQHPGSCLEMAGGIFACGRDPYFPPWVDVLQLNAFREDLRKAVITTLSNIAEQCDGVRCDMAMLVLNSIFARTWGWVVGPEPTTDYWCEIISAVKKAHPDFIFVAEAYWGLEWKLQQQGFDFCYDKTLYDRLEHGAPEEIRLHLCADLNYQGKLLRFIENHDEPRASATFQVGKERAIALTIATLPGAKLFHEGQFEGRKVRLPVFLARRPAERFDRDQYCFYTRLLEAVSQKAFHDGQWALCQQSGWPDNDSYRNLLSWTWTIPDDRYLIAVNLSDVPAQALVQLPWRDVNQRTWRLVDLVSNELYIRDGNEMSSKGLYVALAPWGYHFFQLVPAGNPGMFLARDTRQD